MTTPTSSSLRSRAVRMSRGAPVLAAMSLNRRTPRTSSRITSNDHFSPTTSRAEAIEQRRGEAAREEAARDDAVVGGFGAEVAEVTPRAWHKGLAFPTHSGYGPPDRVGLSNSLGRFFTKPSHWAAGTATSRREYDRAHSDRTLRAGCPRRPDRRRPGRTSGVQAGQARPPLRGSRVPGGNPLRRAAAAAGCGAARFRDPGAAPRRGDVRTRA